MNKTLRKIIELSDHLWIQERWKPKEGDWLYDKRFKEFLVNTMLGKRKKKWKYHQSYIVKYCIWLPAGFNPETGNWQIDELLFDFISKEYISHTGKTSYDYFCLRVDFQNWLFDKRLIHQTKYDKQSDIVLKLMWLCELIEEEDEDDFQHL